MIPRPVRMAPAVTSSGAATGVCVLMHMHMRGGTVNMVSFFNGIIGSDRNANA